ncbi:MAG: sucrase ferredoxin [Actinomycetes bacterium]
MSDRTFCAATSERLDESLVGTASTVGGFLVLEHGGPWGQAVLRHASFPDGVRQAWGRRASEAGLRPMLMRRPGAGPGVPSRPRVVLAACEPLGGAAAQTWLDDVRDVASLPLDRLVGDLRAGRTPDGWQPVDRFLGTCTHGRHDACCAERGRPVARALHDLVGDDAWEVSHMGGDRFAGNVLVLPDGLYYGRVTAGDAPGLVAALGEGRLLLEHLRGRTSLPFPAQAAEVALRRHLGLEAAADVRPAGVDVAPVRAVTHWDVADGTRWRVVVDTTHPGPPRALTCSAESSNPPVHTVVELAPADAPGRGVQGWDEAYATGEVDASPSPTVVEALAGLAPGRALDLAAGAGRHTVWLAERGWQVTALDFSPVGVTRGHAATEAADLAVDWHVGDARHWEPPAGHAYDLVLVAYAALPDVVRRASAWLAPGGRVVVVGHSVRNLTEGVARGPKDPRLMHSLEALRDSASGLDVERLDEVTRSTDKGPIVEAVLVARRAPA